MRKNPLRWRHRCNLEHRQHYLPSSPGVYALFANSTVFYIGKTNNLKHHWSGQRHPCYQKAVHNNCQITWHIVDAGSNIAIIEKKLIKELSPEWNNVFGGQQEQEIGFSRVLITVLIFLVVVVYVLKFATNFLLFLLPIAVVLLVIILKSEIKKDKLKFHQKTNPTTEFFAQSYQQRHPQILTPELLAKMFLETCEQYGTAQTLLSLSTAARELAHEYHNPMPLLNLAQSLESAALKIED